MDESSKSVRSGGAVSPRSAPAKGQSVAPTSPSPAQPDPRLGESTTSPAARQQDARQGAALASVSLPKGGGAIRDLGEKYSVNPTTGTGNLAIPIPLSQARLTPQLQLSYDSGAGNGPFGFGWNIGVPAITRKTDKGLPRYRDGATHGDESDVFILTGSEDLVPLLDASGSPKTTPRTVFGTKYEIRYYRPRIEGAFSRIERWRAIDTGVSHWRTISRDNVTAVYGLDSMSCIADPVDPRKIFSWLICRTWDSKGNLTLYDYLSEDSVRIDTSSAHEANRTKTTRGVQRYLSSIRYGNLKSYFPVWAPSGTETPLPPDFAFCVALDYGDHSAAASPAPNIPWPVRPDPFSSYRAGFEVRTYRRVQRVLLFNNFPKESTAGANCLVRSLDLTYSDQLSAGDPRNPIYTFLVSVVLTGHRQDSTGPVARALPPLEFTYSQPSIQPDILTLDRASLDDLPEGIDGAHFQWVDLDGEGLSGILNDTGSSWLYKRNSSANNLLPQPDGTRAARARFGAPELVTALPASTQISPAQRLLDLAGAGQLDVVALSGPNPGFYKRGQDCDFEPFRPFRALPEVNWEDPNTKLIDLTGDGLADVLISEDGLFTFHMSLGEEGFDAPEQVHTPWDEERGPKVVLADGTDTIFVADMTGDGLNDLVRVRNGEVCYWPNVGYGHFGAKVTMDGAPRFDNEERFDPKRVRLADIDGTGSADLLYVGHDGVRAWFNQSGNSWSSASVIAVFPAADSLSSVKVLDLLGTGTACLVWSSPLPGERSSPLRYVDLMGGEKPHLLLTVKNNMGAETRVTYAPSTRFYLDDRAVGKTWATRLPFPVHVVERVEIFDWIGRNRLVTRYAYHHGYFDGYEREFRGFGMVEQWDTEEYRADSSFADGDFVNWDSQSWTPPTLTRTWFHTGAFLRDPIVSQQYSSEYWIEPALRVPGRAADAAALRVPDTVIPDGLSALEVQEAYRALKGHALRIETYGLDGSPQEGNPYTVTEQNFTIRCLQHRGENLDAVFFVHPREVVSFHYERSDDDPRIGHEFTLETDEYGNATRLVSIGYPRRSGYAPPEPTLAASVQSMLKYDQTRLHIVATEHSYTNVIDDPATWPDSYRVPLPAASNVAEITGVAPSPKGTGITDLFSFVELDGTVTTAGIWQQAWTGSGDIPYEATPASDIDGSGAPATALTRRFVSKGRIQYRSDDLSALLPPGQLQPRALPGRSYTAALTLGQLAGIFGALVPVTTLTEGGYVQLAGESGWWVPSDLVFFSPGDSDTSVQELANALTQFFTPRRSIDPFGAISRVGYDQYVLLPVSTTDPVGNQMSASNSYRVMQAVLVTDANGNRNAVEFDALGLVTATAVMGKTTENLGDSLSGYTIDLDDPAIATQFSNPLAGTAALLGNGTTRIIRDLTAYQRTASSAQPSPPAVYTLTRETHVSPAPTTPVTTQYQFLFVYCDGFGRDIQHKARVAPGPLTDGGPVATPRWVGSGWTIFNNKGNPVRRYEPFFSASHTFEFAAKSGVATTLLYDAPGRVVATLHADNSWEKAVFDGWKQQDWDRNDTVLINDPRMDSDVGGYFKRCLGTAPFTSWYNLRKSGTYGSTPEEQQANQDAAQKVAAHAGTPGTSHLDALGRACLAVGDNGAGLRYPSRSAYDTQSKPLAIFDALGQRTQEYCLRVPLGGGGFQYLAGADMAGNLLYRLNIDAGPRRLLNNVLGNPIRSWDARGHVFRIAYDAAQRPTRRYVSTGGGAEILIDLTVYGEGQSAANLCERVFRHYDMAGYVENSHYDFKGNLVANVRQLAADYHKAIDWSPLAGLTSGAALDAAATTAGLIPSGDGGRDRFAGSIVYDALNRPIQAVTLHNSTMKPDVLRPGYDEGAQLVQVNVWLQQAVVPTAVLDPATADQFAVKSVQYNARGQRRSISFGNGTQTLYDYDQQTFRLAHLTTNRPNSFAAAERSVQALAYFYDPVGNVTRIRDDADIQDVVFFKNQRVEPSTDYTYDPLYRLITAIGREHLGQNAGVLNAPQQVTNDDSFRAALPQPGDGTAMGVYTETYLYDTLGNLKSMSHQVGSTNWVRRYAYQEISQITAGEVGNRLTATSLPGDPAAGPYSAKYNYDSHGNMVRMPHLTALNWDEEDRLRSTTRQVVTSGTPVTTYYAYEASGRRVRKVTDGQAGVGQTAKRTSERIYLGGVELYREYGTDGTTISLERETLHVDAGSHPIAFIETRTIGTDKGVQQLVRYQHSNHLASAALELDDQAGIISYEEYFPFGSTSYQAVASQTDTPKRYRFTDRERDTENDLYYHGARYYAPWIGRWTASDPTGLRDGPNLYAYAQNNPIKLSDPTGTKSVTAALGDLVVYADQITNRLAIGANVQKDHAISQKIIKTILGPLDKLYKEGRELTVAVETGAAAGGRAARWHTIKSTLEKPIQALFEGMALRKEAITVEHVAQEVEAVLKSASGGAKFLSREQYLGMLSQLGNLHAMGTPQEVGKLAALIESGDAVKLAAAVDKMAKSTKGVAKWMKVLRNIAKTENAAAASTRVVAATAKIAALASKAAPLVKAIAPIAKVAGRVAGVVGIGVSAVELVTAKNTEQRVDAGIGLVGNALLASKNPVAMAGGAGILTGQYLEHKLNVSEFASQHGVDTQEFLKAHGAGETTSFVAGAVVTIASTPFALGEAIGTKIKSFF